jgi:hypothetical protein
LSNSPQTNQVLVYLPFEDSSSILSTLNAVETASFRLHCGDLPAGSYHNVQVYPLSKDGFQANLLQCESVLTNAGFQLIAEALQLGRRILVKPVLKQVEQESNALTMVQLELAWSCRAFESTNIANWLKRAPIVQMSYPNVAKAFVSWLVTSDRSETSFEQLCQEQWAQVRVLQGSERLKKRIQQPIRFKKMPAVEE